MNAGRLREKAKAPCSRALLAGASVPLGGYDNTAAQGAHKQLAYFSQLIYFSQFWGLEAKGQGAGRPVSGEGVLAHSGRALAGTPRGGEAEGALQVSVVRAPIPFVRLHPHDLITSQRPRLPIPSRWG